MDTYLKMKLIGGESVVIDMAEVKRIDIDKMDEHVAYEFYLRLKKKFEISVDCKIFTNCNYVGNCQRKSSE